MFYYLYVKITPPQKKAEESALSESVEKRAPISNRVLQSDGHQSTKFFDSRPRKKSIWAYNTKINTYYKSAKRVKNIDALANSKLVFIFIFSQTSTFSFSRLSC